MSTIEGLIDLVGLDEFKTKMQEYVQQKLSYEEKVYIGIGQYEDADMTMYEVGRQHEVLVPLEGEGFIWLAYPKNCQMIVTMGGFEVPFDNVSETVIDDRLYKVDRSVNTYNTQLEVGLILKY